MNDQPMPEPASLAVLDELASIEADVLNRHDRVILLLDLARIEVVHGDYANAHRTAGAAIYNMFHGLAPAEVAGAIEPDETPDEFLVRRFVDAAESMLRAAEAMSNGRQARARANARQAVALVEGLCGEAT